jgi:hypothetical protein
VLSVVRGVGAVVRWWCWCFQLLVVSVVGAVSCPWPWFYCLVLSVVRGLGSVVWWCCCWCLLLVLLVFGGLGCFSPFVELLVLPVALVLSVDCCRLRWCCRLLVLSVVTDNLYSLRSTRSTCMSINCRVRVCILYNNIYCINFESICYRRYIMVLRSSLLAVSLAFCRERVHKCWLAGSLSSHSHDR